MRNVGLFFGSFNPVHIGHLAIAGYILEYSELDEIWFVVSPQNPLKTKETLLADHHRLYLAELAIGDNERLRVSDIEFRLPVPSYTIDTLAYLGERNPYHKFSLIIGEDNLFTLHKWKNAPELVKKYPLYVYPRPDINKALNLKLDELLSNAEIHRVNAPLMGISGTMIRQGIREGKDMSFLIPSASWKYIKEMHFYE
jgi:nicotinate-nucleotide adenylyltransferase